MQPIINPIYFYLMEVVDGISTIAIIATLVGSVITAMGGMFYYMEYEDCRDETNENRKKMLKIAFGITIFLSLIAILTPTSKTITKMIVAQNITVDRVNIAQDIVVKVYEDITKIMKSK